MTKQGLLNVTTFVLLYIVVCACTAKKEHGEGNTDDAVSGDNWEQMDEFHMVMAESFHPFKDSANLEPAKANAVTMAAAAEKWQSAELPKKVDSEEIETKLLQLKVDAQAFAETVNTQDDAAIGESLTKLHDLFHELQEAWYGGHDDHEDHH